MSKVLFISNFRDGTGWSHGAIDYALALDAVGVEVVVRTLKLAPHQRPVPDRILELEQKSADGCDVCIQMVLPHMLEYSGRFRKNIALYFTETDNFAATDWPAHINKMDEVWAPCWSTLQASRESGVTIPVHVVHYPSDIRKFRQSHKPLPLRDQLGGNFLFYTIGEMVRRKNLAATIKAFHLEFAPHEPVELLIKTAGVARQDVINYCNEVKRGMKLYPSLADYKQELILTDYLSEADMLRLHETGDCFIGPSYGEGWGIPAFEAMAMGKTPIVTDWSAFEDFMSPEAGYPVPGRLEPVFGMDQSCPIPNLYSSRERWCQVDMLELCFAMRYAYSYRDERERRAMGGIKRARLFSYEIIGQQMKGLLEQ
jgi:glycosyltransferase involved in cell wall biosynthesis